MPGRVRMADVMSQLADQLAQVLTSDQVSTTATPSQTNDWLGHSGGPVAAVVHPTATDEVSKVLQLASQLGVPVQIQSGNTGLVGGSTPPRNGEAPILLCLDRMTGVRRMDSDTGELIARAGTTIAEVQDVAAQYGWRYGVDLAARDTATIGGTVATNAGGVRVCAYGSTRAQVLGLEFVLADGAVVSDRPGLSKDNTGYDLVGLLCGSEGTLAVVTQVRVKLWRPPMQATTLALPVDGLTEAAALSGSAAGPGFSLLAAEVVDRSSWHAAALMSDKADPLAHSAEGFVLLLEVGDGGEGQGVAEVITERPETVVATQTSQRRLLWQLREIQTTLWSRLPGALHKFDVSVPATELDALAAETDALTNRLGGRSGIFGHIREGNLHIQLVLPGHEDPTRELLGLVGELGGSISAEHGIGRYKSEYLDLRRSAAEMATMRAVKKSLDPQGLLNPGVLFR